jgi:hypothetical protein
MIRAILALAPFTSAAALQADNNDENSLTDWQANNYMHLFAPRGVSRAQYAGVIHRRDAILSSVSMQTVQQAATLSELEMLGCFEFGIEPGTAINAEGLEMLSLLERLREAKVVLERVQNISADNERITADNENEKSVNVQYRQEDVEYYELILVSEAAKFAGNSALAEQTLERIRTAMEALENSELAITRDSSNPSTCRANFSFTFRFRYFTMTRIMIALIALTAACLGFEHQLILNAGGVGAALEMHCHFSQWALATALFAAAFVLGVVGLYFYAGLGLPLYTSSALAVLLLGTSAVLFAIGCPPGSVDTRRYFVSVHSDLAKKPTSNFSHLLQDVKPLNVLVIFDESVEQYAAKAAGSGLSQWRLGSSAATAGTGSLGVPVKSCDTDAEVQALLPKIEESIRAIEAHLEKHSKVQLILFQGSPSLDMELSSLSADAKGRAAIQAKIKAGVQKMIKDLDLSSVTFNQPGHLPETSKELSELEFSAILART